MLLGENGRRHEDRDLAIGLHRLEGRAHRDLRLAVADVADEQSIHRTRALHVLLHVLRRPHLIRRILEQEARLQLALPRAVGKVRRARGDVAARVQVEQLGRHFKDRAARFFPLLRPLLATEPVQARRRRVLAHGVGGTIALDLVEPVQGDVEAVAPLVLDHRDLDRALFDDDRLHPAVDADAVLEMDDVVPRLERGDRLHRRAGAVAARPPDAPVATEDLVVGEHAKPRASIRGRQHEPAVEHADRQRRRTRRAVRPGEQLLQSLGLASVVAEDDGRHPIRDQVPQAGDVALDRLWRAHRKPDRAVGPARLDRQSADHRQLGEQCVGTLEELLARRRVLTATAREVEVVLGLGPRPRELRSRMRAQRDDDDRVARPEVNDRGALAEPRRRGDCAVDGEDDGDRGVAHGALRQQVEVTQLGDLVAPEFEAHRLGHPEPIDIEDPAAHRELRDILDHRCALEADRLEVRGEGFEAPGVALAQLEARVAQGARQARSLEQGARRREEDAHVAVQQSFDGFHTFARHFGVRLEFAEPFPRRIERDPAGAAERVEVREPALGVGYGPGDHDEKAGRVRPREGGDEHGVARAGESGDADFTAPRRKRLRDATKRRERFDRIEEGRQRHQAAVRARPRRATTDSAATARSARSSSGTASGRRAPADHEARTQCEASS